MAYIAPIHKKGDFCMTSNYRPISLTCSICKIMERVVTAVILDYLLRKKIINKKQHGFIARHSTTTNLLESTHDWSIGIDTRNSIDIIYIDFYRAFDSVVHTKLLFKLEAVGIGGKLLNWISEFLSNRLQCVVIDGCKSLTTNVISGVIQGSCLGPVLFVIFVNDVAQVFSDSSVCSLYADDIKLYFDFKFENGLSNLTSDLAALENWAKLWQLDINIDKCQVLQLGHSNGLANYNINDTQLSSVGRVNDLGVIIDRRLKFNDHIESIVKKGFQRLAILKRGFLSRDHKVLIKAYTTYVRPVLESATCVWSPVYKKDIDLLERVQKRFTKMLYGMKEFSYVERLVFLDLEPLELRRLKIDLVMYFKIVHGYSCLDAKEFFTFDSSALKSRHHDNLKLVKPRFRTDTFKHSFFVRCVDVWNSLSFELRSKPSLHAFKANLDRTDLKRFLRGSCFAR